MLAGNSFKLWKVSDSPLYSIGNSLSCVYRRSDLPSAHERFIFNASTFTSSATVLDFIDFRISSISGNKIINNAFLPSMSCHLKWPT